MLSICKRAGLHDLLKILPELRQRFKQNGVAYAPLLLQVPAAMQKDLLFKSYPEKSFHNAMVLANHELHESPVDDMQSGTTAVNILVRGTGLYVANVGDSRAVLAERQGGKNVAINLTVDQTAFRYFSQACMHIWSLQKVIHLRHWK